MSLQTFEPSYLSLYYSGELQRRVKIALEMLSKCFVCPRECGVDRVIGHVGDCKIGRYADVAAYFPHFGEEDCLRGMNGSGTIFFSLCNLHCVFCQNTDISQNKPSEETSPARLAAIMLDLQKRRCHNINLISPDHIVPQILEALLIAVGQGLRLPLVYNSSAYASLASLRLLDGIVDIYLPDFKFWNSALSRRYLKAEDYPEIARQSIKEMQRQVGVLQIDSQGVARRGVLVRHLVMPGQLEDAEAILRFIAEEVSPDTYVSLMDQYHPAGQVSVAAFAEINMRVGTAEHEAVVHKAREMGLWRLEERR